MSWAVCVELVTRRHTFADRLSSAAETNLGMPRMVSYARAEPAFIRDGFATALSNSLGENESRPGDQWASQSHHIAKPRRSRASRRSGFMRAARHGSPSKGLRGTGGSLRGNLGRARLKRGPSRLCLTPIERRWLSARCFCKGNYMLPSARLMARSVLDCMYTWSNVLGASP